MQKMLHAGNRETRDLPCRGSKKWIEHVGFGGLDEAQRTLQSIVETVFAASQLSVSLAWPSPLSSRYVENKTISGKKYPSMSTGAVRRAKMC
jgi:hypothetical protein